MIYRGRVRTFQELVTNMRDYELKIAIILALGDFAVVKVDSYARFHNRPEVVVKDCYAEVEFYFHNKFRDQDFMLAFVRRARLGQR
ncbi:uncharacterized protein VTP21DRAFT_11191 [Calcarisporiella thermophila]|uniref:uncharacterized protein n=1 Tax=Calcarisporiella thermophila TaxID=911321 RepID=UPI003742AE65